MHDLLNKKFGRLTVISFSHKQNNRKTYWICKCECGNEKVVRSDSLKDGSIVSCGCYHSECSKKRVELNKKHSMSHTRLHGIWIGLKYRCYNSNSPTYKYYGLKGISICDEWINDFNSFKTWAHKNGYNSKLTIDRIDSNGNYEPNNCRWVNMTEQNNNKCNNVMIEYKGEALSIAQWKKKLKFKRGTLEKRLKLGWTIEDALFKEVKIRGPK